MITKIDLQKYHATFNKFIQDTRAVESAILSSTKAGFNGSGYSLEVFGDGTYRVLWNGSIRNLYDSEGIIISIPELVDDEYDGDGNHYFGNAIDYLKYNWREYLEEMIEDQTTPKMLSV